MQSESHTCEAIAKARRPPNEKPVLKKKGSGGALLLAQGQQNKSSYPLTCEDDAALLVGQKLHNEADWKSPTLYLDPYTSQ